MCRDCCKYSDTDDAGTKPGGEAVALLEEHGGGDQAHGGGGETNLAKQHRSAIALQAIEQRKVETRQEHLYGDKTL